MQPAVQDFILYGKIAGAAMTFIGVIAAGLKWILPNIPFVRKITETNQKVELLLTNHYPHIQSSLNAQDLVLSGIRSDVKNLDTKIEGVSIRLDDTKAGVHTLGEAFVRHLEAANKEVSRIDSLEKQTKKRKR